jgi:hypothetical protein
VVSSERGGRRCVDRALKSVEADHGRVSREAGACLRHALARLAAVLVPLMMRLAVAPLGGAICARRVTVGAPRTMVSAMWKTPAPLLFSALLSLAAFGCSRSNGPAVMASATIGPAGGELVVADGEQAGLKLIGA